jgi:hypothetical protein
VNGGEIYLRNRNTKERIEDENFEELKEQSMLYGNLKNSDVVCQNTERAGFKPWFDTHKGHCQISVFPQHLVNWVVDPEFYFSTDACPAVLFELPGVDGVISTTPRYEVFGIRDADAAESTQKNTVHFVTDGENDYQLNADDVNPFVDPETDEPIYPVVWWRNDTTQSIYMIGDEDALIANRAMNRLSADMLWAIIMKAYGVWVHTMAEGGKELGVKTLGPSQVTDLAPGATLENLATGLPVQEIWTVQQQMIAQRALMRGLPSHAVVASDNAPESGYALTVRNRPLEEHRQDMIDIYRPYVIDSVRRLVIVHNTYQTDKQINLSDVEIVWSPGDLSVPIDPEAQARTLAQEIEMNISTAVDGYMEKYDVDREAAEKAVQANREYNAENSKGGQVPSQFEGGEAEDIANRLFPPEEDELEEEEVEEEETE